MAERNEENRKEMLSEKEFGILALLADCSEPMSQRRIQEGTVYSLATVNRVLKTLVSKGFVQEGRITSSGLAALEPYRVKRAIFLAAGFGSRLVPVTLNTPKPLVRVNGERIIDRLIDACLAIGIEEIYIIRGYLAEQFDLLRYKYPMIRFIENQRYNETNNIYSMLCVRTLISNAYVLESDLLISNPKILRRYHYTSDFLAIRKAWSDDWCFTVKDGTITEEKVGGQGEENYQMVGISFWNEEDGRKLADHIEEAYRMPGGKELYWEQVPLVVFRNDYHVKIQECRQEDITEIDTFRELCAFDQSYNPGIYG
ncbi:MAG: NTP transferase domain-containing protein [Solobacterium sp.]|nr:NTP transferase domain-containing protein [Solobacterium sp.]